MNNAQLLNEQLLNTEFRFKSNSKLGQLVHIHSRFKNKRIGLYPRFYTLRQILMFIKYLVYKENLFSSENKYIVICSPELKIALGESEIHVCDIRDKILSQVIFRHRLENQIAKAG
jgi:hypothetical protein